MATWDRLSALDASFLGLEDGNAHMHVGGMLICDAGDLLRDDGGLKIERIRRAVEAKLHLVPHYRQKVAFVPYEGHPIWVDDERFNLEYHVRLSALPRPGGMAELKRLTGRVMSQELDRGKPLWELWCVEGLAESGFAMIWKTHHCLADGMGGSDIVSTLLDPDPATRADRPQLWTPKRPPHAVDLAIDTVRFRLEKQAELLRLGQRAVLHPGRTLRSAQHTVQSVAEALAPGLRRAAETPLNLEIGPHRAFTGVRMELDAVKDVKNALGGTVNDVVLATVAGALRRFFRYRRVGVDADNFRVMIPVSVRGDEERGTPGNMVTGMIARLPIDIKDPAERLAAVTQTTKDLKRSKAAVGAERLTAVAEWTVPNLLVQAARAMVRSRPFNLVVTNVPGPQIPLYMEGALMRAAYPVVPLAPHTAVGVALFSYNGHLYWGLNADWDAVPDVERLASDVEMAFAELCDAAKAPAAPRKKRGGRPGRASRRTTAKASKAPQATS